MARAGRAQPATSRPATVGPGQGPAGRGRGVLHRRPRGGPRPRRVRRDRGPRRHRGRCASSTTIEPDLVLLDIMLPKLSGIDVCRTIRSQVLGADHHGHRQGDRDRHRRRARDGRRRLRRQALPPPRARRPDARRAAPITATSCRRRRRPDRSDEDGVVEIGGVRLDTDRHRVFVARQARSTCAARSSSCCELLIENPGRVLTRDTLIDRVWGTDYVGDTKTLDVHIKRLRVPHRGGPLVAVRSSPPSAVSATASRYAGERLGSTSQRCSMTVFPPESNRPAPREGCTEPSARRPVSTRPARCATRRAPSRSGCGRTAAGLRPSAGSGCSPYGPGSRRHQLTDETSSHMSTSRRVDLEVEGAGGRVAEVAGAQVEHPVLEVRAPASRSRPVRPSSS